MTPEIPQKEFLVMERVKVGDRVKVSSEWLCGAGTVTFIDEKSLYINYFLPIQVELDEPDEDGHYIKRFSLKEVQKK